MDEALLPTSLSRHNIRRIHLQHTASILVQTVLNVCRRRAILLFESQGERLVVAMSAYLCRQEALEIGTPIGCVVLLIPLVVTKHIDAIEVWFVERVWLIGTALFENQPTSWLRFASSVFVTGSTRLFNLTIQTLPGHKLSTRTIENNVARYSQFNLLAVDPARGCRRSGCRKSHLVPELVCFLWLSVFLLPIVLSTSHLRTPG